MPPAPVLPLAQSYQFSTYSYPVEAPTPPKGYTALLYAGSVVAFVSSTRMNPSGST